MVEPWLRGTMQGMEPVRRAVLHALELAVEDAAWWCEELTEEEMFARPAGLPTVAFHMRHMVRSLDRLLTYAEGRALDEGQLKALRTEMDVRLEDGNAGRAISVAYGQERRPSEPGENAAVQVWNEFREGMQRAMGRVRAVDPETLGATRAVGREGLPTTVAGLLVHCAEHTQRHAGQMVTTAKVVRAMEG